MSRDASAGCKHPPGIIAPEVDFSRCEGKADCATVCPENVFEIRRIDAADYQALRPLQRFKLRVHGMRWPMRREPTGAARAVSACPRVPSTPSRSSGRAEARKPDTGENAHVESA